MNCKSHFPNISGQDWYFCFPSVLKIYKVRTQGKFQVEQSKLRNVEGVQLKIVNKEWASQIVRGLSSE